MERAPNPDLEIKRAAQLSITEISLGSIGHAFKIPFTGQILSLNQLGFLLNALNRDRLPITSAFEISSIAAVLKSFSPAGQKLGPMLSIAMQGFLFWLASYVMRAHLIGQLIGSVLLSLWAFVQPFISYLIIYGFNLIELIKYYENRTREDYTLLHQSIFIGISIILGIKVTIAIAMVFYSVLGKKEIHIIHQSKILALTDSALKKSNLPPWRAAIKDLFRPLFIISFILMIVFVWQIESSWSQRIWMALRPLAIAYLLFYFLRSPWVGKRLEILSKRSKSFERIYLKSKAALDLVTQRTSRSSEVSSRRQGE